MKKAFAGVNLLTYTQFAALCAHMDIYGLVCMHACVHNCVAVDGLKHGVVQILVCSCSHR